LYLYLRIFFLHLLYTKATAQRQAITIRFYFGDGMLKENEDAKGAISFIADLHLGNDLLYIHNAL
jgi:hypothetical protein